jgi:hypothetical protein
MEMKLHLFRAIGGIKIASVLTIVKNFQACGRDIGYERAGNCLDKRLAVVRNKM